MPIEVDTSEAPTLIRVKCVGPFPTPDEQTALRARLMQEGKLTEATVTLLDVRELETPDAITLGKSIAAVVRDRMPTRRACIINPGRHLPLIQYFQAAVPWMSTAAFIDEREALEWLLNPEGSAGFRR